MTGAGKGFVKRTKTKTVNRERLTLAPLKFEEAPKALIGTGPSPSSKKK